MKRRSRLTPTSRKKVNNLCDRNTDASGSGLNFLSDVRCYIHPANFGTGRLNIFKNLIKKHGGEIVTTLPTSSESVSHVIFEESIDSEKLKLLIDLSNFHETAFVKCTWLIECVKAKSKSETKEHEIIPIVNLVGTHEKNETNAVCTAGKVIDLVPEDPELKNEDRQLINNSGTTESSGASEGSGHAIKVLKKNLTQQDASVNQDTMREVIKKESLVSCNTRHRTGTDLQGDNEVHNKDKPSEMKTLEQSQTASWLERLNDGKPEYHQDSLVKPFPKRLKEKFACARPSSSKVNELNAHITSELEKLAAAYKSKNDTWRALGYQKAVSAIRNHPREITSREEALGINGVGERLADKVAEIIESGKLRKVSEVCEGEEAETLKLFMGVWGAGPTTAQSWYTQGFRTLEDLRTKATLSRHQQIGLEHYDDINSRIPRDEVAEIEQFVRSAALSIKQGLIVMVCGSYRRGKPSCGDVDVLITHPDGHSHENLFKPLLNCLKETGFITNDLVIQEDNGNQQKYLGVCKLPGEGRKHRRLDVIVVPYAEFAPATMYFTGSAHFNRSMRLLATKMGMSLSEHGLRAGIVRQGREKLTGGHLLETPTEASIFAHLGLEYRSPEERDH
ncbi:DNA polymerase lambda [Procambarus clarkii]|uniref:DNA polymerase lambda n=1 Tax=Procambarus clarkii TaxID=6728 RepID=UPI003742040F